MSSPPLQPPGPYYRPGPSAWTRWLAILLLLVAGALVWVVVRNKSGGGHGPLHMAAEPRAITPRGDLAEDEKSTIDLFDTVSKSVVHITTLAQMRSRLSFNVTEVPQGTGSGFIWDAAGHIVTNFHVAQSGDKYKVTLSNNHTYDATLVGGTPDKDLAVLQLEGAPADEIKPIAIGTSGNLKVGQKVFAIGNPFGLDQTLTTGVISGLGREIQSVSRRPISDVIQTDAAINPGNSGGPLLDSAGRIIGINTAIYSPSGAYAGIGFAVPVDTINLIVPQLISNGRIVRPGLGVSIFPDSAARAMRLEGVVVRDVSPGGAADRAGITGIVSDQFGRWMPGDVIVGFDGGDVTSQADLFRALDKHKVGDTVTLKLLNRGKTREVRLNLQEIPQEQ